jgi:hypothetical protein
VDDLLPTAVGDVKGLGLWFRVAHRLFVQEQKKVFHVCKTNLFARARMLNGSPPGTFSTGISFSDITISFRSAVLAAVQGFLADE